jgi:hypothetical protein
VDRREYKETPENEGCKEIPESKESKVWQDLQVVLKETPELKEIKENKEFKEYKVCQEPQEVEVVADAS